MELFNSSRNIETRVRVLLLLQASVVLSFCCDAYSMNQGVCAQCLTVPRPPNAPQCMLRAHCVKWSLLSCLITEQADLPLCNHQAASLSPCGPALQQFGCRVCRWRSARVSTGLSQLKILKCTLFLISAAFNSQGTDLNCDSFGSKLL